MKDSRAGETLWSEWTGNGLSPESFSALIFYTEEHVDFHNEIVKRALASAIQRDGSVHSLGDAFRVLDSSKYGHSYVGIIDGEPEYTACDLDGMTTYGDEVEKVIPITWVEINV